MIDQIYYLFDSVQMMTDYFKMTTDARSNEQAVLREKSIRLNAIRSYNRHQEAVASSTEGKVSANETSTSEPLSSNKIASE